MDLNINSAIGLSIRGLFVGKDLVVRLNFQICACNLIIEALNKCPYRSWFIYRAGVAQG